MMKGVEVCINVIQGAKTIFLLSYSIKDKIEVKLEQLVNKNIFKPTECLEWASSTVPVKKMKESLRTCGNYKVTVNNVAEFDKYPMPNIEDLLETFTMNNRW